MSGIVNISANNVSPSQASVDIYIYICDSVWNLGTHDKVTMHLSVDLLFTHMSFD